MANSNMMHRTQAVSCFHLKNISSVSFKIIIVFISQYQFPAVLLSVFTPVKNYKHIGAGAGVPDVTCGHVNFVWYAWNTSNILLLKLKRKDQATARTEVVSVASAHKNIGSFTT